MRWPSAIAVLATVLAAAPVLQGQLADAPSHQEALELFRAGQEFLSAEQFDRAADAFSKSVGRDRLLSIAHYGLGQSYMNLRRYASAAKAYKDCIESMRTLHLLQESGRFEVDRRREDEIRELKTVLNQSTRGTPGPTVLVLEQRLRDLEAQRRSIGAPFQPPAEVLLALGSAYFRNGESAGAEANWKAAIDVNPKYGEAHNNIAVIYMQTGRLAEAEQEVKLAEKNGFRVNPQFKTDLKDRQKPSKAQ